MWTRGGESKRKCVSFHFILSIVFFFFFLRKERGHLNNLLDMRFFSSLEVHVRWEVKISRCQDGWRGRKEKKEQTT